MYKRGYCPFRVEILKHSPGCVLLKGKDSLCYSTDHQPLIHHNGEYSCPLKTKVVLSEDTYALLEKIVSHFLTIQDKESTTINVWPMLKGIANSRGKTKTDKGKEMVELVRELRAELDELIFEMD